MPKLVLTLENSMRAVRILHAVILYTILLFVYLAEKYFNHEVHDVHLVWLGFLVVGLSDVGIAFYFRIKMLQPVVEALQTSPDDRTALGRWRFVNILSYVLAESVALLGFALRFIGGTTMQSIPFYAAAIALMLLWWPRRP